MKTGLASMRRSRLVGKWAGGLVTGNVCVVNVIEWFHEQIEVVRTGQNHRRET